MRAENGKEMFAFVIMPFAPEFDNIYADLIVSALESAGYEVRRADSAIDQQNILKDIVYSIDRADLIVAELTSLNPNVLYELGIAHGLLKPTVLLTQTMEDVPFDLRSYRMIVYSTRYDEIKELKDQLRKIAQEFKGGQISFGNPVSDFAPSILQARQTMERRPKPREGVEVTEMAEEAKLRMFDFLIEAEHFIQEIGKRIERISDMNNGLNQKMATYTASLEHIKTREPLDYALLVPSMAESMASDMIQYAEKVEAELPGLHDSWERFVENTANLVSIVSMETTADRGEMVALCSKMQELLKALGQARAIAASVQESISQMEGTSPYLINRAVQRIPRAINRITEEFAMGESYAARILNLLSERLETEDNEA